MFISHDRGVAHGRRGVVMVLSGFPRRSETFALAELAALDRAGLLLGAFATKPGDGLAPHPDAARILRRVEYLPDGDDATQAAAMLDALGDARPIAFHGYFAHQPAAVAARAAGALGVPYGFSVHAKDARKVPAPQLRERARKARCVIACNTDAHGEITRLGVPARLVPHGVNLKRFAPARLPMLPSLQILAVGRLVQKKGFHVLLKALAQVESPWALRVVGDGPEGIPLRTLADDLGLSSRITWHGSCSHAELPALYADAHVVAVPSVVDDTGDRDGLPNVVLEALASERTVVATRVGAIESAIVDGDTGWLVNPGDARGLAHAIEKLARKGHLARALAFRGRRMVERQYDVDTCAQQFIQILANAYA